MDILSPLVRQELTEIKANLEKSLSAWESFLNLIEVVLIRDEDWVMAEEVSGPVAEALNRAKQALQIDKEYIDTGKEEN